MKVEYQFTIARTDRIYLVVFVLILLSWELIKYFIPETTLSEIWGTETSMETPENKNKEATTKSFKPFNRKQTNSKTNNNESTEFKQEIKAEPKPLAIMEASKDELISIGFTPYVAGNIIRYTSAGGVIKNEADVLKIYGMDSSQWRQASPFILFPKVDKNEVVENTYVPDLFLPKRILDMNTATAIDLDSLPGIGSVFADRIINYRNSLGGFYDLEQIKACYGIPPETIDKIRPLVTITQPLTKQHVNEIDWKTFYHPYLDKKYRPMILAYKKNHGAFKSLAEFRKVFPPDTSWCDALLPYLTFESEN